MEPGKVKIPAIMVKSKVNKYAVLRLNKRQYLASEGDELVVDRLSKEKLPKDKASTEVLLFVDGDKVKIGKPILKEVKAVLKVLGEEKGKKIEILKYKAKSRYRKHLGFRPQYTRILLEKLSI